MRKEIEINPVKVISETDKTVFDQVKKLKQDILADNIILNDPLRKSYALDLIDKFLEYFWTSDGPHSSYICRHAYYSLVNIGLLDGRVEVQWEKKYDRSNNIRSGSEARTGYIG
ncbi:MAG: hypothetical protein LBT65_05575 [Synergistaceae bacterium]|jgi:hypothetical protein|nr:hypothetical protein [Synergistaceae bacterium]